MSTESDKIIADMLATARKDPKLSAAIMQLKQHIEENQNGNN